ncbi:MAG: hypothetical protein ACYCPS_00485 [Candidatus Saccharimonadales bacterium]
MSETYEHREQIRLAFAQGRALAEGIEDQLSNNEMQQFTANVARLMQASTGLEEALAQGMWYQLPANPLSIVLGQIRREQSQ